MPASSHLTAREEAAVAMVHEAQLRAEVLEEQGLPSALRRKLQHSTTAALDAATAEELKATAPAVTRVAPSRAHLPLPQLTSTLVDGGLQVPRIFRAEWQSWKACQAQACRSSGNSASSLPLQPSSPYTLDSCTLRLSNLGMVSSLPSPPLPQPPAAIALLSMHLYAIRVGGVRSERHLGLLCRERLPPSAELPPLFIFPHGIMQREVDFCYQGELQLTAMQIEACERFHLRALHGVLTRPSEGDLHATAASGHEATPAWSSASFRHYLIVSCRPKQAFELAQADEEGWRRVDDLDEHFYNETDVRSLLVAQAAQRAHLCDELHVPSTAPLELGHTSIDEAYMASFCAGPRDAASSRVDMDAILDQPRTHILETKYNGRMYLNLARPCAQTALSPFPNPEYSSYFDYYCKRWPQLVIPHLDAPLILAVNFAQTPLSVLQPHVMTDRKRRMVEPEMLLVADATTQWTHCSADMAFLLRMMPAIMHRLEMNLLQHEFAKRALSTMRMNPPILAMALTSGNAQENFALQPLLAVTSLAVPPQLNPTQPLTHAQQYERVPSTMTHSYERLKFLGDSLLKLVACKVLLQAYPHEAEEALTQRKGAMLNMNRLAIAAVAMGLQHVVVTQPFQPTQYLPPGFRDQAIEGRQPSSTAPCIPSPTKVSKHVLADVVASLVGAAWFSGGEVACMAAMIEFGLLDADLLSRVLEPQIDSDESIAQCLFRSLKKRFAEPTLPLTALYSTSPNLQLILDSREECQKMMGYTFERPMLFVQSFTHSSWERRDLVQVGSKQEALPSFERLELLGDAVLEVCCSTFLFHSFPWCYVASSGDLSFVRQKMVANEVLAKVMVDQQLDQLVMHTSEPVRQAITAYREYRIEQARQPAAWTKALSAPKMLADVMEALLGAIYLDSGCAIAPVWMMISTLTEFHVGYLNSLELKVFGGASMRQPPIAPLTIRTPGDVVSHVPFVLGLVRHMMGGVIDLANYTDSTLQSALASCDAYQELLAMQIAPLLALAMAVGYDGVHDRQHATRQIASRFLSHPGLKCHLTTKDNRESLRAASRLVRTVGLGCTHLFPLPSPLPSSLATLFPDGKLTSKLDDKIWSVVTLLFAVRFPTCLLQHAVRFNRSGPEIEATDLRERFQRWYALIPDQMHRERSRLTAPDSCDLVRWLVYLLEYGDLLVLGNPRICDELAFLLPGQGIAVPANVDLSDPRAFVLGVIAHVVTLERSQAHALRVQASDLAASCAQALHIGPDDLCDLMRALQANDQRSTQAEQAEAERLAHMSL